MKVFLSWSGEISHGTAKIFRDWLPSVIQSIVPYVSSEDIDKGARWSTDIANELENSSFGILCVTKDNVDAPWLSFEAGALSKTIEKSFVNPFLFNIKRAEVSGPILQFQSTIFEREDIKKLVYTLNKACANTLTDERIERAFSTWYPELEKNLNALLATTSSSHNADAESATANSSEQMLEEILDLTRDNQKLLRNPEGGEVSKELYSMKSTLEQIRLSIDREPELRSTTTRKRIHPIMIEELIHASKGFGGKYTALQIALSLFRNEFPWIYESGMEVSRILRSRVSNTEKNNAVKGFFALLDFSFEHPLMREFYANDKDMWIMTRRFSTVFKNYFSMMINEIEAE